MARNIEADWDIRKVVEFARLWVLGGCPTPTVRDYFRDQEDYPGWWPAVYQMAYELQSANDIVKATAETVKSAT